LFWFVGAFVFKQGNDSLCLKEKGKGKINNYLSLSHAHSPSSPLSLFAIISIKYTGLHTKHNIESKTVH
jgi:hypothetical protein